MSANVMLDEEEVSCHHHTSVPVSGTSGLLVDKTNTSSSTPSACATTNVAEGAPSQIEETEINKLALNSEPAANKQPASPTATNLAKKPVAAAGGKKNASADKNQRTLSNFWKKPSSPPAKKEVTGEQEVKQQPSVKTEETKMCLEEEEVKENKVEKSNEVTPPKITSAAAAQSSTTTSTPQQLLNDAPKRKKAKLETTNKSKEEEEGNVSKTKTAPHRKKVKEVEEEGDSSDTSGSTDDQGSSVEEEEVTTKTTRKHNGKKNRKQGGNEESTATAVTTTMARLFQPPDPQNARKVKVFDPYYFKDWPKDQDAAKAPFAFIADVFADISAVGSRLECTKILADMYWSLLVRSPSDFLPAIYLTTNKQAPAHAGVELGIGDSLIIKVISESSGVTEKGVKEAYQKTGDLAEVAQEKKAKQTTLVKPKPLKLAQVFNVLYQMAVASGDKVQRKKMDLAKNLLRDAKGPESNFIVRALQQKMRIGLAENTVLVAVAYSLVLFDLGAETVAKMNTLELQQQLSVASTTMAAIYHEVPSFDIIVPVLLKYGSAILDPSSAVYQEHQKELTIRPGLPVKPMLAHPTSSITMILDRFQGKQFTCEYKYDGERAQIHYLADHSYAIFSRNSETHTGKYPDVINMMPTVFKPGKKIDNFILDSEVVAVDAATGQLQAFQVLQHRGRKNINLEDVKIQVCVFAFDILYLNSEPLLHLSLFERRKILHEHFEITDLPQPPQVTPEQQAAAKEEKQREEDLPEGEGKKEGSNPTTTEQTISATTVVESTNSSSTRFRFAQFLNIQEIDDIQGWLNQSISDGCEGLMVKTLHEDAKYSPAKRSFSWLKLKKDYMDGIGDTLDLVPIGAYHGKGKRTGVFGGFLLACFDQESDEYQSICKIGTGFSEDILEKVSMELKGHIAPKCPPYYRFHENHVPDVWLTESMVWEVKAADLSISPTHPAAVGIVSSDRGIALRFPRFLKVREDKQPCEATSSQQVADMYRAQAILQQGGGPQDEEE